MSGIPKQKNIFYFGIPECRLYLCKVSANRRQDKEKVSFFVEMQPNFTNFTAQSDVKVQISERKTF